MYIEIESHRDVSSCMTPTGRYRIQSYTRKENKRITLVVIDSTLIYVGVMSGPVF